MKRIFKISFLLSLAIVFALQSCSSDDTELTSTHELVGTWQRIDSNANLENKIIFHSDNSGIKTYSETVGSEAISNAISMQWNTSGEELILVLDEEVTTTYYFNMEGQLVIVGLSSIPYLRIE